jgi:hypothetical protein
VALRFVHDAQCNFRIMRQRCFDPFAKQGFRWERLSCGSRILDSHFQFRRFRPGMPPAIGSAGGTTPFFHISRMR